MFALADHLSAQHCTSSPIITIPETYIGCPGESTDPDNTGAATAVSGDVSCPQGVNVTYSDSTYTNTNCEVVIKRTWTAEYTEQTPIPLASSREQVIWLKDGDNPYIHNCPSSVTLEDSDPIYSWNLPTASDDCGIDTLFSDYESGSSFPLGTTVVTYTAIDLCGNTTTCSFTVTVQECSTSLTIDCPKKFIGCPDDSIDVNSLGIPEVHMSNSSCGDYVLTHRDTVIRDNICNTKIERLWTATIPGTDIFAQCTQVIRLKDEFAPSILHCPADVTIDVSEATYHWSEPVAVDDCKIASFTSDILSGSTFPMGSTTVTYTAKDMCGDTSTCSFIITVTEKQCNNDFDLLCAPRYTGCRGDNISPNHTGKPSVVYISDICGNIVLTYQDHVLNESNCKLKIDRKWTATIEGTDISKTCTQRINLNDDTPPVIYHCPDDVTISADQSTYNWTEPSATDNCSQVTLSSEITSGSSFPVGTTEVVYKAKDECGNVSKCSFKVTVKEVNTGHLLIHCPDDIVIDCGENLHLDKWPLPQVNTSCTSCEKDHIPNFINMGEFNGHRYFCSKYSATWEDAKQIANDLGGHLAVIESYEENHYLSNKLQTRSAYIGLTDRHQEGHFKWVNGEEISYHNWYPGQPNNYRSNQDYVELLDNGKWNDQYNYKKLEFIIEFPCVQIEQTKGPASPAHFNGNYTTIEYKVTDGCGNVKKCSYRVSKYGSLSISCPQDIVVNLGHGHHEASVHWDEPEVETCCSNCNTSSHSIPGFVYMGSRNGHHYYCSEYHATWDDAQEACERNGGYLAVIEDEEENKMLANFLKVQSAYIGLSDHHLEGHFRWVNGTSMTYTNWYPKQPNNYQGKQHYVEMLNTGQWNDQYAYKKREFIMELPGCVDLKQTKGPANGSKFPIGTTTVKYLAKDNCGNQKSCSFTVTVKGTSYSGLCPNDHADSKNYWIQSVQLGHLKNISGNDHGYGNYSSHCFKVERGEVAEVNLSSGYWNDIVPVYWSIFIDWDKNGKFKNSELIAKGKSKSSLRGYFKFSSSLPLGKFNMRVTMNPYTWHSDGCDPLYKGEVEDYCIEIKGTGYVKPGNTGKSAASFKTVILEEYDAILDEGEEYEKEGIGIEETDLHIFPNPFEHQIQLSGKDLEKVRITTPSGQLLKTVNLSQNESIHRIDLREIGSGLYLIVIEGKSGRTELKKVIKK